MIFCVLLEISFIGMQKKKKLLVIDYGEKKESI
jgi:hypothetical protein